MKIFHKIALLAALASAPLGCANAGDSGPIDETPPPQTAPTDAVTPTIPAFDGGRFAPQSARTTVPASVRASLPRGAKSIFCLKAKLRGKDVFLHAWNPATGNGYIDMLAPTTTRSRTTYMRFNRVKVEGIALTNYSIRLVPFKANKAGWVMSVNWSQPQVAGAFSRVSMAVFIAPDGDSGRVLKQDAQTESSAGGNEFYDLRVNKNGDAFLMLNSESFDAQIRTLRPYRWNGSKFVNSGESATRPLIFKGRS